MATMSAPVHPAFVLTLACLLSVPSLAQQADEVSTKPLKPLSRRELDRREALQLYGQASDLEHRNRLPEALRLFEKARRFDPDSPAILRALVPLYVALDRQEEALQAYFRIVALDPEDYETWYNYAKALRAQEKDAEARKALGLAAACKGLKEQPELHLAVLHDLGALQEKAGDAKAAEANFREVIALLERPAAKHEQGELSREELVGQLADTYERIGRLCLRAGQTERAVEAFQQAQKRDPARAARLSYNVAEVLAARKQDAEALRYLDQYLARQPQGIEGYELKLKLLRRLNRGDEIVAALEEHSKKDPYHNALKQLLAREYQTAGRLAEAERTYLALLTVPQPEVYRGLFSLYRQEGKRGTVKLLDRLDRAIKDATPDKEQNKVADSAQAAHVRAMLAGLREERDLIGALLPLAVERILNGPRPAYATRSFLAALAERTGQLDAAEQLYRSCLDSDGKVRNFGIRQQAESEVYGGLLNVLARARKHKEIVELCRQGLKHAEATNRVLFHYEQARALMALGKAKEALEASKESVDTAADDHRLTCKLLHVELLAQAAQHNDAISEGRALFKEYKGDEDRRKIRFTLSTVYSAAGEHEKAEEQLKVILEADPLDAHANNDLGYLWADRNRNLNEAERMIRKALELDRQQRNTRDAIGLDVDRDNAAYIDSLGWVLFRRGRLREAREQLEKAVRLPEGAHDPVVWDHLGDVYRRLKEERRAADAWRRAVKLFDEGQRPQTDERYKDIQQKLHITEPHE
jgi:tetratricopeptide (TPR) repeat protein